MRQPDAMTVPVGPCKVRALFSWSGEDKRDLGFVEGDIIQVLNTGDGNWWTGRLKRTKQVGLFPRNFVEFVDKDQEVAPLHGNMGESITDLSIPGIDALDTGPADPLGISTSVFKLSTDSQQSTRSTKSAEEILKDIEVELNRGYLDDISLNVKPEELDIASLPDTSQILTMENDGVLSESSESAEVPVPPVHREWPQSMDEARLMKPLDFSPDLASDVPFDPISLAEQPKSNKNGSLSLTTTKIAPNVTTGSAPAAVKSEKPKPYPTSVTPSAPISNDASVKVPNASSPKKSTGFLQKLLPRNSQLRLKRVPSGASARSGKSFRSMKSIKSIKGSLKSILSRWTPADSDLYPSNFSATPTEPPMPAAAAANDGKWMASRRDLYRAKTLLDRERADRLRALELQGVSCKDPARNFQSQKSIEFRGRPDLAEIDEAIEAMSTWPQLMTPAVLASSRVGRRWTDPVARVRAVFVICATRIDVVDQQEGDHINVVQTRKATPLQLANCVVAMCEALGVESRVVEGHFRSEPGQLRQHAWAAIRVPTDGSGSEWRLLDAAAASPSFDGGEEVSEFYFLTPPQELIYTHLPTNPDDQLLDPPVATSEAALLPVASPAAFAHDVMFVEYAAALTRLSGLETAELVLRAINPAYDLVATVDGHKELALAQAFVADNQRRFRVKAVVPVSTDQATLRIYAACKQELPREAANMELLWTVPLRHTDGENASFEFISRYASPTACQWDIYVVEPQCRQLGGGETYTFRFIHAPTEGADTSKRRRQPKLAVQSPSGRITRLVSRGTEAHDTAVVSIKTLEVGTWRAVISTQADEWVPFGEWFCS